VAEYAKPLPIADSDTKPYWDGAHAHQLVAQRCRACGTWRWPPRGVCPACYSWDYDWQELAGTGTVQTFVAPHRAFSVAFKDEAPYVIAHVALDGTAGNVVIIGNLVGCPWADVRVGMRVQVVFEDATDAISIPKFRPA
jgi:uncharacterized OB-fold protein